MAKKSTARGRPVRPQQPPGQQALAPRRQRLKLVLGGVILALVLGIGGLVYWQRQRDLSPRLQGAVGRHYTRGTAGAPVVIKEFSDYT